MASDDPPSAAAPAMAESCPALDAENIALDPEAFNDRTQPVVDCED
jgi:hypothetical protein